MSRSRIKQVIDELEAVEAAADVNALTFGGLQLWPLVRRMHHFTRVTKDPRQPKTLADLGNTAFSDLNLSWSGPAPDRAALGAYQEAALNGSAPVDVIFVSRLLDHTDTVDGLYYNRLIDPWLHLTRGTYQCLKLEFSDGVTEPLPERFEPTYGYALPSWQDEALLRGMPGEVDGFAPIIEAFRRLSDQPPSFEGLSSYLPRLWARQTTFIDLLERLKPRAVCVICYYSADMLALVWACRQLGIPIIDIQHGQQGLYHALYNHWTATPTAGYDLVPDYFFCWDERIKSIHSQGMPQHRTRPHSLVTGNAWISLWREPGLLETSAKLQSFLRGLSDTTSVLVGLQPQEDLFPQNLYSAMRRTPDWRWLIRVHPHQRHRIPDLRAYFDAGGLANAEIDVATHAPLYALLREVDHLVTPFSSVAWEANAFGCPVTLIDPQGREAYTSFIDDGTFNYAEKADAIVGGIVDAGRAKEAASAPSLATALSVLQTIVEPG